MEKAIEAFAEYHRQKELLTDYIQVAAAALSLLRRNVQVADAPALLGAFVDACGVKHWGKGKKYSDPTGKVVSVEASLANLGIIQHVAAFDYFSRNIVIEAAKFSERARQTCPKLVHGHQLMILSPQHRWVMSSCCNEVADHLGDFANRLDALKDWLEWRPSEKLAKTLPLFDLLRRIRNRIAHYDGIVGADLEEFASSQVIVDAFHAFRIGYAKKDLPTLPQLQRGRKLGLDAVHPILFGAFLYEIAKEVNAHVAELLTVGEFVDMAFYYSTIVDEHPFRTIRHRSAENRINYFLAHRYLSAHQAVAAQTVIQRLQSQVVSNRTHAKYDTTLWGVARHRHEQLLLSAPVTSKQTVTN